MTNSDWESFVKERYWDMFPTVRGWLTSALTSWLCWADPQMPCSTSTLTPWALAGFPEVHREAQALCPLLSDPGAPTPAVQRWSVGAGFGQHLDHLLSCLHSMKHRENVGAGARGSQPPSTLTLRAPTRSQPPGALHLPPIHLPLQSPTWQTGPPSRPHLEQFTCIQLSTSEQQPLPLLPPSFPFIYCASLCHRHFIKGCHLQSIQPKWSLMQSWFQNPDWLSRWTHSLRCTLSAWIDLTFLPLDFLIIYSSNSSPSLLPAPCTWVSIYFLFIHFHSYKFNSYVFLW